MCNLSKFHQEWLPWLRYTIAIALFACALQLRFWMLPIDAGLRFLTFYPAILLSFYLCGTGPGILSVILSTIACYAIFAPPAWTLGLKADSFPSIFVFMASSCLIGWIIHQLQVYTRKLNSLLFELKESEARYKSLVEDQTETICRYQANGTILYVNEAFCRFYGKPRASLLGQQWRPRITDEDRPAVDKALKQLCFEKPVVSTECRIVASDGLLHWVQSVHHAFFDPPERLIEIQVVGRDISNLKKVQEELHQLTVEQHAMLDNEMVGIAKVRDRRFVWYNQAINHIFGYPPGELNGARTRMLYADHAAYTALGKVAYRTLRAHGIFRTQLWMTRKNGEHIWVDISGVLLPDQTEESLWMFLDMTSLKKYQEEVEQAAFHDPLTNLPNRLLFSDRLKLGIAQAERTGQLLAVCYLDLDGFKLINDQFGHATGDKILIEIAHRIEQSIRVNDTACRLGGDEFVLLLTNLEKVEECDVILKRLMIAIGLPISINHHAEAAVTASLGLTFFPFDGKDPDTLLRHADQAMYEAKKQGRNRIVLYSTDMQQTH
jgi:diguanylate cyclase (GGDEF)-like protein/PAS domain S-box-containing protein